MSLYGKNPGYEEKNKQLTIHIDVCTKLFNIHLLDLKQKLIWNTVSLLTLYVYKN